MPATPKRMPHGERTRLEILEAAVTLAASEGLEGLTIGRLADRVGMSKTGLFTHFGSKEALQLATVDAAYQEFLTEVVTPAMEMAPGVHQLGAVFDLYFSYVERRIDRGGCFFTAATLEMDDRPGKVHDAIANIAQMRGELVVETLKQAVTRGELKRSTDIEQLAFELTALASGANLTIQLQKSPQAIERVRKAFHRLLDDASLAKAKRERKAS